MINACDCAALQRSTGAAGGLCSHPDCSVHPGVCGLGSEGHPENPRQSSAFQGLETLHQLCFTVGPGSGRYVLIISSCLSVWSNTVVHPQTLLLQLESVAECASRLRILSKALDVSDLRLDGATGPWTQELVRLQGAGLGLDIKESLLEAWGLVLLANNQLDPTKSGEAYPQRCGGCRAGE